MRSDLDLTTVSWHTGALNNGFIFGATYHGVTRLPRRCSYAIGHAGTWLAYHLMRDGTRALVANLRTVRPEATERELRSVAQLTYRSYALDTIDFIRSLGVTAAQLGGWMAEHRDEGLAELRRQHRGVMVVSGHFGNWELGGVTLRLLSGCPVTLVGKIRREPDGDRATQADAGVARHRDPGNRPNARDRAADTERPGGQPRRHHADRSAPWTGSD